MEGWAKIMAETAFTIAEMTAIGLNLPPDCLKRTIENGLLELSPPGSDLETS